MSDNDQTLFQAFLNQHDDEAWRGIVNNLLPSIHEVDRNATEIWFRFYPLALLRLLEEAEDSNELARELQLQGRYYLKDQVDSSHWFLYGHRYWPEVKTAVVEHAASAGAPSSLELGAHIRDVAASVAKRLDVPESLTFGVTAIAFMTLQHVGFDVLKASAGVSRVSTKSSSKSPEEILRTREIDDSQGLLGFLRGDMKVYSVVFNENDRESRFKLINTQHLTTAAASDKRPHYLQDPRCIPGEGPIPVQCRSAACGTCWVGVLGGSEKLSEVAALEWRRIKEFGYIDTDQTKPLIRLACQARAFGAASIVIPPWNGVFGRHLERRKAAGADAESMNTR